MLPPPTDKEAHKVGCSSRITQLRLGGEVELLSDSGAPALSSIGTQTFEIPHALESGAFGAALCAASQGFIVLTVELGWVHLNSATPKQTASYSKGHLP